MALKLKRNDIIGLFFFTAFVISTSLIYQFEERFDQERWRSQPAMRYKMADDIIEKQLLIGKSKDEVILLLGQPTSSFIEKNLFFYRIGKPPSFSDSKAVQLLILFDKNLVIKVTEKEE